MPFLMVRGDIAKMRTDAVVIPAAGAGQPHKIRLALCRAIMRKSFGSSAPSIIYVIVPAWTDDRNKREQLLEKAYRSALRLAVKNDLRSIAFPLLSSGNTRFAQEEAFRIARSVITAVVRREELSVYLVLQDHDPFIISHELSTALTSYIAVHEPKQRQMSSAVSRLSEFVLEADEASLDESLEDLLSCRQETFSREAAFAYRPERLSGCRGISSCQPRPASLCQDPQQSCLCAEEKHCACALYRAAA